MKKVSVPKFIEEHLRSTLDVSISSHHSFNYSQGIIFITCMVLSFSHYGFDNCMFIITLLITYDLVSFSLGNSCIVY